MTLASNYLLLGETSISFSAELAGLVGMKNALLLEVLHEQIVEAEQAKRMGHIQDGRWWVLRTYREWHDEHLPFWRMGTLVEVIEQLVLNGLVHVDGVAVYSLDTSFGLTIDYDQLDRCIADPTLLKMDKVDCDDAPPPWMDQFENHGRLSVDDGWGG